MPAQRLVLKFGGTSVGSGDAIGGAAGIAADLRRAGHPLLVVTSAMSSVTDALLGGAAAAIRGEGVRLRELTETLRARHHAAALELDLSVSERAVTLDPVDQRLAEFAMLCDALAVLGEASPRALDAVASLGERMCVHLLAAALRKLGTPAVPIDATEIIRTDDAFQSAAPDMSETRRLVQETIGPMLEAAIVPVVTGFIGATSSGVVTTLGRGGSDYSAAILGAAIDADEVWIYTDVDGVMTADPRVVPDVRTLDTLSYREMSELAYFGAKVLHPSTILPAVERNIPVRILNSWKPDGTGTLITAQNDGTSGARLTGLASKKDVTIIDITSTRMLMAYGFLRRVFEVFERFRTAVDMVTTSEVSVSVTVDDRRNLDAIVQALSDFSEVSIESELALLCAVGDSLQEAPEIAARVVSVLEEVPLKMISQAASRRNITVVLRQTDLPHAMQRLHEEFFA
jgi:aspartate kinase